MRETQAVKQWASTLQIEAALSELKELKAKYAWVKCDRAIQTLTKLSEDLPKVITIIQHQDKQNAMHVEFIRVSQLADAAITNAICAKFNIEI